MKTFAVLLVCALFVSTAHAQFRPPTERDSTLTYVHVPINFSLWSSLSVGQAAAPPAEHRVIHNFALHVLSGKAARLNGLEVSGLAGVITEHARGIQVAGLAAVTGEDLKGIQVAGLAAVAGDDVDGIQAAGLAAVAGDDILGLQLAGLAAVAAENVRGGQFAGLFAVSGEDLEGFQGGGLFAVTGENGRGIQSGGIGAVIGEDFRGLQNSGVMSIVGGNLYGLQTSGVMNITGGTMHGVQMGFLNLAPQVRGMQLGMFNIADTLRGVPVGVVSYVRSVGLEQDVWADETGTFHTSIRSGTRRISNFGGIGVRPGGDAQYRWSAHTGIGVELPISANAFLTLDALSMIYVDEGFKRRPNPAVKVRLAGLVRFSPRFAVFAGGSVTGLLTRDATPSLVPNTPWTTTEIDGETLSLWRGGYLGLRFQLRPPQ